MLDSSLRSRCVRLTSGEMNDTKSSSIEGKSAVYGIEACLPERSYAWVASSRCSVLYGEPIVSVNSKVNVEC
jgi:hypothetical protein